MREIKFRACVGFSGYEVGDDGSVFSLNYHNHGKRGELKQHNDKDGYREVVLWRDGQHHLRRVHKLVADAFLPDQPTIKHQVNHMNGVRSDNQVGNLEWLTSQENTKDGFARGRTISLSQREAMRQGTTRYNHNRWHQNRECTCVL